MPLLSFEIPGRPIGKKRHRTFIAKGGHQVQYTPKETENYEALVRMCASEAMRSAGYEKPFSIPLRLGIKFYFPVAATRAKKIAEGEVMVSRPDWSNCEKSVEDGAIGVIYHDDSFIVAPAAGSGRYWTHKTPRAEVWVVAVDKFGNEQP